MEVATRASAEAARAYEEQIEELRSTISSQFEQITSLKKQLASLPNQASYEKLQSQVIVLRQVQARMRGDKIGLLLQSHFTAALPSAQNSLTIFVFLERFSRERRAAPPARFVRGVAAKRQSAFD